MPVWIDTHCHWDAAELRSVAAQRRALARARGVAMAVVPAVSKATWRDARGWAHEHGDVYALGIHPLCVADADPSDLEALALELEAHQQDPQLVAIGEIGLDGWVNPPHSGEAWDKQWQFFVAQLQLAKRFQLPVVLHVRSAVDSVLKGLRQVGIDRGIAHAFNGSDDQAAAMARQGLKLGFGGACTFDAARRLRHLATHLPPDQIVMETDGPDIPPQWLYVTKAARDAGVPQGVNASDELPAIAQVVAALRDVDTGLWAQQTTANACLALPRMKTWMDACASGTP
ncbi:MAG: hypothetical protein RL357_1043 [Pseudomonadota bacterium]